MSLLVFQKIRPVYICTYSQVYKCIEKQLEQYTGAVNMLCILNEVKISKI